jgi:hypothetical protein
MQSTFGTNAGTPLLNVDRNIMHEMHDRFVTIWDTYHYDIKCSESELIEYNKLIDKLRAKDYNLNLDDKNIMNNITEKMSHIRMNQGELYRIHLRKNGHTSFY